jgi:sugar lactone lactonase YvrE
MWNGADLKGLGPVISRADGIDGGARAKVPLPGSTMSIVTRVLSLRANVLRANVTGAKVAPRTGALLMGAAWFALAGCQPPDDADKSDDSSAAETDDSDTTDTTSDTDTDTDPPLDTDVIDPCAVRGVICRLAGTVGADPVTGAPVGEAALGADGIPPDESSLYNPASARVGPDGLIYIADFNNHRVRRIDANGLVQTVAGSGVVGDTLEGAALASSFNHPTDVAWQPGDNNTLWIASWHNWRIDKVNLTTGLLTHFAGSGAPGYTVDGEAAHAAAMGRSSSIHVQADGTVIYTDQLAPGVRAILPDGTLDTLAGPPPVWSDEPAGPECEGPPCLLSVEGWSGDGGPAVDATLRMVSRNRPTPAAWMARQGDVLFFTDSNNHVVRAIDLSTGLIRHVAGVGEVSGYAGDGGPATAARFFEPTGIAVDTDGTLYVADTRNSCVRQIDPDGIITTIAGQCGATGYAGDGGPANEALMAGPLGVTIDPIRHRLLVADQYNNLIRTVGL